MPLNPHKPTLMFQKKFLCRKFFWFERRFQSELWKLDAQQSGAIFQEKNRKNPIQIYLTAIF